MVAGGPRAANELRLHPSSVCGGRRSKKFLLPLPAVAVAAAAAAAALASGYGNNNNSFHRVLSPRPTGTTASTMHIMSVVLCQRLQFFADSEV